MYFKWLVWRTFQFFVYLFKHLIKIFISQTQLSLTVFIFSVFPQNQGVWNLHSSYSEVKGSLKTTITFTFLFFPLLWAGEGVLRMSAQVPPGTTLNPDNRFNELEMGRWPSSNSLMPFGSSPHFSLLISFFLNTPSCGISLTKGCVCTSKIQNTLFIVSFDTKNLGLKAFHCIPFFLCQVAPILKCIIALRACKSV